MTEAMTTDVPITDNAQPSTEVQSNWYDGLGDGLAEHPSITKFTSQEDLAKSYVSLQTMFGQEKIPIPKSEDDVQAWEMYNKAFGVPDSHEGYNIETNLDPTALSEFTSIMHKNRIPDSVANNLFNEYVTAIQGAKEMEAQQFQQEASNAENSLRKEWGIEYDKNIEQARNYLIKVAGDEESFNYYNEKVGNDPKFIKLFAKMGESISEGELGGFEGQNTGFGNTPAEAKTELDKILNDPNHAYWAGAKNKRNDLRFCKEHGITPVSESERKDAVNYVNSLMKRIGQGK
jgi:hypothetical protein